VSHYQYASDQVSAALPRSTPAEQGVDAAGIDAFIAAVAPMPDAELHSLMVLRHGRVVAETWWEPYTPPAPHLLYSMSKSFTSTALGFAVAEGLVDLDATVLSYFPEFDSRVTDERSRSIRVRHVAAMASGHDDETIDRALAAGDGDMLLGFLLIPPDREPGTVFAYNQPCTYSLSAIIQRVSGGSLTEYLRPRLFEPLGIAVYGWRTDVLGRELGYAGLHVPTEAIAKVGQLYLQNGEWDGRRLLAAEWVAEATRSHVTPDRPDPDWNQGYGFQFWQSRHGYRGDGAYGQFMLILPEADAVVAITSQSPNMQGMLNAAWDHLLPALTAESGASGSWSPALSTPSASDARASDSLSSRVTDGSAGSPSPSSPPSYARDGSAETASPSPSPSPSPSRAGGGSAQSGSSSSPPSGAGGGSVEFGSPSSPSPSSPARAGDGSAGSESPALAPPAARGPAGALNPATYLPGPGNQLAGLQAVEVRDRELVLADAGPELAVALGAPGAWTETGPVATAYAWADGRLLVDVVFVETPHRLHLILDAENAQFEARWQTTPIEEPFLSAIRMPR
jgi:CubicO group peptidase (beta-lactamase class C family)